jgi:ABC-type Fe3+ transport system permease subunit
VLAFVTLPRARASLLAAALFVVVQTAAEVGVTEMTLVPTLAEETRAQFARGDGAGLERTLVLSLPGLLLTAAAVLAVLGYVENRLPPLTAPTRGLRPLEIGPAWMRLAAAVLLLLVLMAPLGSLVWKLGLSGYPGQWHLQTAKHFLAAESRLLGGSLALTLATAACTGCLTAGLALLGCCLARDCRWFRWLLFGVLTWVWVLPGPVVGIGLHTLIRLLPAGPWKDLLYYGSSPAPLIWVQTMRALPIAVVFLWPVVRAIPAEWLEEARLGGAGPISRFLHVVAPLTWRSAAVTAVAASALCLGEVGASARVETPGWQSFTGMLLNRIHTGVDNTVAALALLMLGSLAVLVLVGAGVSRFFSQR